MSVAILKPDANTVVGRFDTITEFRDACMAVSNHSKGPSTFTGGESFQAALSNLIKGKLDVVPEASALMDKVMGDSIETTMPLWSAGITGVMPLVPAYLAGDPMNMLFREETESVGAPLRVFISACSSAGVSVEDMRKRGIVALALCQKLSVIRPVELWVFADMGDHPKAMIPMVRVEASPLDLSTATYALSSAGFLRQLCFTWSRSHGWELGWAWGGNPTQDSYRKRLRKALGATEDDLVIYGQFSSDKMLTQPVEWLNRMVAHYGRVKAGEEQDGELAELSANSEDNSTT